MTDSTATLYVHVPFCVVKCGYCDFNSYAIEDGEAHARFVSALDLELTQQSGSRRRRIAPGPSIFIGGGTPSYLDAPSFERLFEVLHNRVDLDRVEEWTMEANPESCDERVFRTAQSAGVDRISLGVQSFDDEALRFLDRRHRHGDVDRAVQAARNAGFENLSLDLIYGLPGQSPEAWRKDLETALALEPDHLSCYQLTYEPGTALTHALERGQVDPIDSDQEAEMFHLTHELLGSAGFDAYETSNFAGRGGPSRHNDHYWLQGDYLGVGPGAASHRRGWRTTNLKPLQAWAEAAEAGLPPAGEGELLTREQRLGEALWLGLRRRDGVDLDAIGRRLGLRAAELLAPRLIDLEEKDLVERDNSRLRLTTKGRPLADAITTDFLALDLPTASRP